MTPPPSTRKFWEARAAELAAQINTALWLERVAPLLFFGASVFAVSFYALRRVEMPLVTACWALGVTAVLIGVGAWWRARKLFFAAEEAQVFLESQLQLDARLTAASLGLVAWPPAPKTRAPVVRWQPGVPVGWLTGACALLGIALFAPVPLDATAQRHAGPPPSLAKTDSLLAALKEMKVADPQALESLEERARQLASRPRNEQYSHSALEAADALRSQTEVAAAGLARGLDSAAKALQTGRSDREGSAGRLSAALSGLRGGDLPVNQALLDQLPAGAADLTGLSAEQLSQIAQQLAGAASDIRGIMGAAGEGVGIAEGEGTGDGEYGGEGGGGETAPLMLAANPSDVSTNPTALSAASLKRFALGDKLGTRDGHHEVDPTKAEGTTAGGAVAAPASGGEAVWVNRLTPAERGALKQFFK